MSEFYEGIGDTSGLVGEGSGEVTSEVGEETDFSFDSGMDMDLDADTSDILDIDLGTVNAEGLEVDLECGMDTSLDLFEEGEVTEKEIIDDSEKKEQEIQEIQEFQTIMAEEIDMANVKGINGEQFWNHHGNTKEDYMNLAEKLPTIQKELDSGKTLEEIKENPELKDSVKAYYARDKMIKVEKAKDGQYYFEDDGRHRIVAAKELGYAVPVKIVEYDKMENAKEASFDERNLLLEENVDEKVIQSYRNQLYQKTGDEKALYMSDRELKYFSNIFQREKIKEQQKGNQSYEISESLRRYKIEKGQYGGEGKLLDIIQTEVPKIQYERQWKETSKRVFITNGKLEVINGKEILRDEEVTYGTAVNRMSDMASALLKDVEEEQNIRFREKDKREMKERIEDALKKQQAYTDKRGLGEHGIKHIYGNIERSDYALRKQDVSASARLAALVAQIYHDEGYTIDKIHNKVISDKEHDKASRLLFEQNQKDFFQRFFIKNDGEYDQERMEAVLDAIGMHNEGIADRIKENTNPVCEEGNGSSRENHLIVSAVHISDKCALSENEKMIELYENEKIMSLLTRIYETGEKTLDYKRKMQKELENIPLNDTITREAYEHAISTMEETESNLKSQMKSIIKESDYPMELKESFCEAIDKDISLVSAKFTASMNDIALSGQAFELIEDEDTTKAKITLHVVDYQEASDLLGEKLAQKQVTKIFEDMGVAKIEAVKMALAALEGEVQELEGQNILIQVKKIGSDQIENNHVRKEVRREINEGVSCAKEIFTRENNQEKKIICDKLSYQLEHDPESITKHDLHKLIRLNNQGSWQMRRKNMKRWKRLLEKCTYDESEIKRAVEIMIAQTYTTLTEALIEVEGKE